MGKIIHLARQEPSAVLQRGPGLLVEQSSSGGALGAREESHVHTLEAASLLKFVGGTISRGFVCLWEPPWTQARARLPWNPGATLGELWLWDSP